MPILIEMSFGQILFSIERLSGKKAHARRFMILEESKSKEKLFS